MIEHVSSSPAAADTAPTPVNEYVAPSPAGTHAAPAPVIDIVAYRGELSLVKRLLAAALAEAEAAQREVLKADTTLANFNAEAILLEEEAQQTAKKKGQAQEALSGVGSTGVRTGGMRECRSQPGVSWTETLGAGPGTEPCVAHPNAPRSEAHASQPLPTDSAVRFKNTHQHHQHHQQQHQHHKHHQQQDVFTQAAGRVEALTQTSQRVHMCAMECHGSDRLPWRSCAPGLPLVTTMV